MRKKDVAMLLMIVIGCVVSASPFFNENLSGTSNGNSSLAGGSLPVSFSVRRSKMLQILGEEDEKATLSVLSGYSLSGITETTYFDMKTGTPPSSWLNNGATHGKKSIEYFEPTGTMSISLSQKIDEWTYTVSLGSRYSSLQESLKYSADTSKDLTFSRYDGTEWTGKYTDSESLYAYPWLYGERSNLTNWMKFSAFRSISTIQNLNSLDLSLSLETGPWWLLNSFSNGDVTLSDYFVISAGCSQSMLLKDEEQSISLRWLKITLSHSNSFSYTFGKTVPRNKLNSFRLRGFLSDNLSLTFSGPQILDSGTSVSVSFTYGSTLHFGGFENEKSGKSRGLAYSSSLSSSFGLSLFGILSFSYSLSWQIAGGYTSSPGLSGSGEVSMAFSL